MSEAPVFPRVRNGWEDSGNRVNNRLCPNCGSAQFKETISVEYCPSCGLLCDYWGDGPNKVYEQHYNQLWDRIERETEARVAAQMKELGYDE